MKDGEENAIMDLIEMIGKISHLFWKICQLTVFY